MEMSMKRLVRVQLVNWHYFSNERISLNGSTLISGENTAGKSTILDAIQLVLTTNTRRFNVAANEKGKRNLKGYVRCKVGNVGQTYRRKGAVPAHIALEFYEDKSDRYFVLGVCLFSADEESPVVKKWYVEECRLEDLNFVTKGRASLADELRNRTRKISYIESDKAARDRFRRRMGNLDEKFFDIIPKSLAFKPMDNVKEFINKFVLSEKQVDVATLRSNIETLDELEKTLEKTKKQLASLEIILAKFDEIDAKEEEIIINDLLLNIAKRDAIAQRIDSLIKSIDMTKSTLDGMAEEEKRISKDIKAIEERVLSLNVDIKNNEAGKQVETLKREIEEQSNLQEKAQTDKARLTEIVGIINRYIRLANSIDVKIDRQQDLGLLVEAVEEKEKLPLIVNLVEHFNNSFSEIRMSLAKLDVEMEILSNKIHELQNRLSALEKKQLSYPGYVENLKGLIEKEFVQRGIESKVYILAELLEITDEKWRDAVEGYLNRQKFYLVVEPEYYNVAIKVYDRHRDRIHSAGIINTGKLPLDYNTNNASLAYVVKTDNRYAKAYIWYLLGRVIRCDKVEELEKYPIAITHKCMLYQGYVIRHLNPKDYRDPYIGNNAYRMQIVNVKKELEEFSTERKELRNKYDQYKEIVKAGDEVKSKLDMLRLYINSPLILEKTRVRITELKVDLKTAQNDPTLIDMTTKLNELSGESDKKRNERDRILGEQGRLRNKLENEEGELSLKRAEYNDEKNALEGLEDQFPKEYSKAYDKYKQNRKTKEPQQIHNNFSPMGSKYLNEKDNLLNSLLELQNRFNSEFSLDFTTGLSEPGQYREAANKISKVEIVRYEDQLLSAKEDCEKIFRSDFLSKMKEHIESARNEFHNLNKALRNIYYGDDSYHFNITYDKQKENLYRMITSEYNVEGEINLWSGTFESEYKDEIDELFAKLMVGDDNGEKVIEEYTDYRSYLDYDIEIRKRNGDVQHFSDIYGEKSGSETQVPYYVAIAASFYQLYRFGNSVRLMLLDEAFDKMDDERITSMMEFMNSLKLQLILATPPQKMEVIGEKVDTILTAIRVEEGSIVDEYELD